MRGTLWAVRHAPPREPGICYGRTDVPVSLKPEQAAQQVISAMAVHGAPQMVWTSPLSRCRDLAEVLSSHFGTAFKVDSRLLELSFGQWENCRWDTIYAEHKELVDAWADDWQNRAPPSGETLDQLLVRMTSWLADINPFQDHLLVAHAGPLRALRVICQGVSWPGAMQRKVDYLKPEQFPL